MAIVKTIDVVMRSHTEQFDAGLKKGIGSLEKFSAKAASMASGLGSAVPGVGQLTSALSSLGPVGLAAAAGLGVAGVAAAKLADMASQAMDRIDSARQAAERLGILTAEFQKLEYAASFADVSTEALSTGLQKMSKNVSEAAAGSEDGAKAFRELGLDVNKLANMAPDKAFLALAESINRVQNPFDKLRLTMAIFGKGGAEFINVFQGGREAIEGLMRAAEKSRIPVTEEAARRIDEAQDSVDRLTRAWEGLGNVLAVKVAPAVTTVMDGLTTTVTAPETSSSIKKLAQGFAASLLPGGGMAASLPDLIPGGAAASAIQDKSKPIGKSSEFAARQKELEEYQKAVAKSDKEIQDQLNRRREEQQAGLRKITEWQQRATEQLNPALAAQQDLTDKVKEINKLFDQNTITLQRRNELLQTAVSLSQHEAQERMKQRQEEMRHQHEKLRSAQMAFLDDREKDLEAFVDKVFQRPTEPPAALELGTAQAFSAFQKNMSNTQRSDETKIAREQLDHIARIRRMLEKERVVLKMADL